MRGQFRGDGAGFLWSGYGSRTAEPVSDRAAGIYAAGMDLLGSRGRDRPGAGPACLRRFAHLLSTRLEYRPAEPGDCSPPVAGAEYPFRGAGREGRLRLSGARPRRRRPERALPAPRVWQPDRGAALLREASLSGGDLFARQFLAAHGV